MHVVLFTHVFKWSFYPHSKCTWYVDHQYASTAISAEQLYNMFHGYIECMRMFVISDSFEEAHTLFKQCWIEYFSFYSNKVTLYATAHDHYIQIIPLKQTLFTWGYKLVGNESTTLCSVQLVYANIHLVALRTGTLVESMS